MNPNDIHEASWMFRFFVEAIAWINPIVHLIGLGIAVWAYLRSRKWGYLAIAIYFALAVFSLLVLPPINRAIRAHRPPDIDQQTQQKIEAAVKEAVDKVRKEQGYPVITAKRNVRFPFGPILLVFGLWLLASHEPRCPNDRNLANSPEAVGRKFGAAAEDGRAPGAS